MLGALLMLAAAAVHPQVDKCAAAVRHNGDVAAACAAPDVQLWPKDGKQTEPALTEACEAALQDGRSTMKVPPNMRWAMVREFEKNYGACANPAPEPKTPTRETVKLWD